MEFQVMCPNVDAGCGWCGSLHELEDHVKCCISRPSQCLYCRCVLPYNIMTEHSLTCLRSTFQNLLKLEEEVALKMCSHPIDKLIHCQNADKHCHWQGRESELKTHLYNCEMEEYKPSNSKRQRYQ